MRKSLLLNLCFLFSALYSFSCTVSVTATSTNICLGGSVTLTATGATTYIWTPINNATNSITVSPTITTTYTVIGTLGNCYDTTSITINVSNYPTITTSIQNDTICQGLNNMLTASGANQYTWMPGNLSGSTINPLPNSTTTYTVIGSNSPGGCSDTAYKTINIKSAPKPILNHINTFSPFSNCGNTSGLPSYTINVNTPSVATIVSYDLNWGDGSAALTGLTQANFPLNHTYTTFGAFSLIFSATYTNGCVRDTLIQVKNQTNPSIGCTGPGNTLGCLPVQYKFNISGYQQNSAGTYYVWDFGDGSPQITWNTVTADSIFHIFNTTSCYQPMPQPQFIVSVSAINSCATTTATVNGIKIFSKAKANFTLNDSIRCINTPVYVNNTSITSFNSPDCNANTSYLWDFGDPNSTSDTSILTNPLPYSYSTTGTYTITLVTYSGCGNDTIKKTVCIENNNVNFSTGTINNCSPASIQFTNTSINSSCNNTPYTWIVTKLSFTCNPDSLNDYTFIAGTNATSNIPTIRFNNQGIYKIRLSHTNSCGTSYKDTTFTIKRKPLISIASVDSLCENISFTPSATVQNCASTSLSYSWNCPAATPTTSSSASPSFTFPPGTYTYTLTVTNDCGSTSLTKTITIISKPIITLTSNANNAICLGKSDTLHASGASSYIWQSPSSGNTTGIQKIITPTTNSTYTITGTSSFGCTNTNTISITVNPIPTFTLSITPPSCIPGNDASITINASSGTPSYSYKLNSLNQITNIFNSLGIGTYTVSVIDANLCSYSTTQNIVTPNAPSYTTVTHVNILCNGGNNGSIQANASGGSGALLFTLQPNNVTSTTGTFTNLIAGTYTIHATDNIGCSAITYVTITQPNVLTISGSVSPVICNGQSNGAIYLTANGGTSSYSYQLQSPLQTNTSGTFSGLAAGNYTTTVTDAHNCSATSTLNVSQPTILNWTSVVPVNISCNGANTGNISIQLNSGFGTYNYTLIPGSTNNATGIFSNLSAQNYTITGTDANNCSLSTTVTLSQPPILTISSISNTVPTCIPGSDATMTVTATGGVSPYNYAISPNYIYGASNTFNNLSANSYTISTKDANLCTVSSVYIISTPNSPQISAITSTSASCNPGNDGTLNVSANAGTPPYQYEINTIPNVFTSSNIFSALASGTYTITVKDASGCTGTSVANIITQSAPIINSVNILDATCNPGCNGSAIVNASSIFTLQYNINNGLFQSNNQFLNLCANSYTISVKDINNCTAITTININTNNTLQLTLDSFKNITCNGLNNGKINLSATGAVSPYTYNLQPGNISNTSGAFTSLSPNTYSITASDANGCSQSTTVSISDPLPLYLISPTLSHINCFGGTDGSISISSNGGTGLTSYTLLPNNITNAAGLFSSLSFGTYSIIVSDANGCTNSTTSVITQPSLLQISSISNTIPTCIPANNSIMTINAIGGTAPFSYSIGNTFQSNNIFTNLGPTIYTVTVKDAHNCSITSTWSITLPNSPLFDSTFITNILCYGNNTGAIYTHATGGAGQINYTIIPGNISNTNGLFNPLLAGNYIITASDFLGCSTSTNLVVNEPPNLVLASPTIIPVSCNNSNTGSISISVNGGIASYSFNLLPNNISNSSGIFNSLSTGNYTISVLDANSCSTSSVMLISQPQAIVFNTPTIQNTTCYNGTNGTITQTANGGTGSFTYLILPGNISNTSGIFNNLAANIYTIIATDINSCSASTTVTITQPTELKIDSLISSASSCLPMNVTVYTSGGSTPYLYSNNGASATTSNIFTGLTPATYTITVSDNNGCTITSTTTLVQPNAPIITSLNVISPSCNGLGNGSINSVISNGGNAPYAYTITPGSSFTNLAAGNYTVIVTDANSCSSTSLVSINQPTPIVLNTATHSNILCHNQTNGSININYTGGTGILTYTLLPVNISNTNGIFNNIAANNYTITVSDAANCSMTTLISISNPPLLQYTSVSTTPISCNGLNNASIVTLAGGGTGMLTYSIFPNALPPNTNGIFNTLAANNYTITVSDINNCTKDTSFSIIQPPPVTGSYIVQSHVSCYNGNNGLVSVFANGGYAPFQFYLLGTPLSNSTGIFNNLAAGTYSIQILDSANCSTIISSIIINQPLPILWDSIIIPKIKCFGDFTDSLFVKAIGGNGNFNYSISPAGPQNNFSGHFYGIPSNIYTITALDGNNCTLSTSINISQNSEIKFPIINLEMPSCNGDSNGRIELYAAGGTPPFLYQFNGSTPSTNSTYTGLKAGFYNISVSDALNCIKDTNILINELDRLYPKILTVGPEICKEGKDATIFVEGAGGLGTLTYSLLPDSVSNNSGLFNHLATGNYTIFIHDSVGCKYDSAVFITPTLNPLSISILKNDLGCLGVGTEGWANANVKGGAQPYNYEWSTIPTQYSERAYDLRFGQYRVFVTDVKGCKISDTIYINPGECCEEVYIPNAFTPNGDGKNDIFRAVTSAGIQLIHFEIYDRWGVQVWSTDDYTKGWDGSYKGTEPALGNFTYHYLFSYRCITNDQIYVRKGDVTLLK